MFFKNRWVRMLHGYAQNVVELNMQKDNSTLSLIHGSSRDIGNFGEALAREYLEKQGLVFIDMQYRTLFGEIDLIMLDQDEIVFVEVRYRQNAHYGAPEETLSHLKRRRLVKTALRFQQQHAWTQKYYLRIDVVGIEAEPCHEITWIPNAIEVK